MEDEKHQIKISFFGNLSYWKVNPKKIYFALELDKQFLTVLYTEIIRERLQKQYPKSSVQNIQKSSNTQLCFNY
jgi:hypothetical protein